ncbi:amino acid kinase family protein, partial [Chlamydia psittaci 06-1683]
IQEQLCVLVS